MNKKFKYIIFVLLLFISIGYASLSTTLDLKGMVLFGINAEDFYVYTSRVMLDGQNISESINESGTTFSFSVSPTTQQLTYRVKNVSTQYDAYVTLSCVNSDNVELNINHIGTITAQTIETRTVDISAETSEEVVCTINIDKVERTENAGNSCCDNASSITFNPRDTNWQVSTVEEALNYLRARDY